MSDGEIIHAPWTQAQVDALNRFQHLGFVHEFTCGSVHDGDRTLVATLDGWVCRGCTYTQSWAHVAMLHITEADNPMHKLSAGHPR